MTTVRLNGKIPLRAILNGKLTSYQRNFYDFIIINNLPDNDFIMARFIGKLLGEYRLSVSIVGILCVLKK